MIMNDNNTENKIPPSTNPFVKNVPVKEKAKPSPKSKNEDFKRKYCEDYDDIKISDRQDW